MYFVLWDKAVESYPFFNSVRIRLLFVIIQEWTVSNEMEDIGCSCFRFFNTFNYSFICVPILKFCSYKNFEGGTF